MPQDLNVIRLVERVARLRIETVVLPGGVELELRYIQPPPKAPGDPIAPRAPFYLARTEVTRAQYAAVTGRNAPTNPDFPQTEVTFDNAVQFCAALAKYLPGGYVRLPSVEDFTLACDRGGNREGQGWHARNSGLRLRATRESNPDQTGLYDLLGNAAEWLADDLPGRPDFRWTAGGNFRKPAQNLACSALEATQAASERDTIGFRVLWEPPPVAAAARPTDPETPNADP